MPASETTGLQINLKSPGGTLINLYATDEADLSQKLGQIEAIVPQVVALESVLAAAGNVAHLTAPVAAQRTPDGPPTRSVTPPGAAAPAGAAPSCAHGARTFKSGISKAGKPYKLWACPSFDRNDQCAPEWVRD